MHFTFDGLPYAFDALEPFIDKTTMEIHHDKHHKAYFDNFVKALAETKYTNASLEEIFKDIASLPVAVKNNAGGYFNHNFFWHCMGPQGLKNPTGKLDADIERKFGNYEAFKKSMTTAGLSRFGSGFVWLILTKAGELEVISTPNQNNPLMGDEPVQGTPIMAIDVWEHAYYLRYQNRRADYLEAFWNVIDWTKAVELYAKL